MRAVIKNVLIASLHQRSLSSLPQTGGNPSISCLQQRLLGKGVSGVRAMSGSTCPPPGPKNIVSIVGAKYNVSQYAALLLKQSNWIDEIRLHDEVEAHSCGAAWDLSHIDTSCQVRSYTGRNELKECIVGSTVVLICGGCSSKPGVKQEKLFQDNAHFVRNVAIHTAEFNPTCTVCVTTSPVAAMVPLITEEYKKARVFDARKVIGLTNVNAVRANALLGIHMKVDPSKVMLPVIGGDRGSTIVGVFSQVQPKTGLNKKTIEMLQGKIETIREDIVAAKCQFNNPGPLAVSAAFGAARFIVTLVRAMSGGGNCLECAFLRQTGEIGELSRYLGTMVSIGRGGVEACHLPPLSDYECIKLQNACHALQPTIEMGEGYVTGHTVRPCRLYPRVSDDCTVVEVGPAPGYERQFAAAFKPRDGRRGSVEIYEGE